MRRYPAYTLDAVKRADAYELLQHLALIAARDEENDGEQRQDHGERQ